MEAVQKLHTTHTNTAPSAVQLIILATFFIAQSLFPILVAQ